LLSLWADLTHAFLACKKINSKAFSFAFSMLNNFQFYTNWLRIIFVIRQLGKKWRVFSSSNFHIQFVVKGDAQIVIAKYLQLNKNYCFFNYKDIPFSGY